MPKKKASRRFPPITDPRHITPISGKDSLATALLMRELHPEIPMEYVWNDTGWELPEVYEWIDQVENVFGTIHRCGDDLTEIVAEQGLLPSRMFRFCTKYAKIHPMRDWIGGSPSVLYFGLRADEPGRIAGMVPNKNQTYRFPLQEHGYAFTDVWKYVSKSGLMPPAFTWQWMVDRVAELGGQQPLKMPEWEWRVLFAGRSRPNCDRCFNQRQYEWVWLHETHPDRFDEACDMEEDHQGKSSYRWLGKGVPLRSILDRADVIKEKRARAILGVLNAYRQKYLFQVIDDGDSFGAVSCGLFCGK